MTGRNNLRSLPDERASVLVVDDEEAILRIYVKLLTRAGLRCFTATSALHALEILGEQSVNLVLTDNRMPGPSGLDLLAVVAERWPKTGRILMTALLDSELALKARNHHRVLPKDLSSAMLVDIICREARRER